MSNQIVALGSGMQQNSPVPFWMWPGAGWGPWFRQTPKPWRYLPEVRAGNYDSNLTSTLVTEITVPTNTMPERRLGPVVKACRFAHFKVAGFQPDNTVIPAGTLNDLLVPLKFYLLSDGGNTYLFHGQPALGIVFLVDFKGGENLSVMIDNTDFRSTVNGQRLQVQLFLNCDPRFDIERTRKGDPTT